MPEEITLLACVKENKAKNRNEEITILEIKNYVHRWPFPVCMKLENYILILHTWFGWQEIKLLAQCWKIKPSMHIFLGNDLQQKPSRRPGITYKHGCIRTIWSYQALFFIHLLLEYHSFPTRGPLWLFASCVAWNWYWLGMTRKVHPGLRPIVRCLTKVEIQNYKHCRTNKTSLLVKPYFCWCYHMPSKSMRHEAIHVVIDTLPNYAISSSSNIHKQQRWWLDFVSRKWLE